ncbi:MAG: hypothetical protein B7X04_03060 [Parcubacteria group bacterium 21-54-25]|nr:MAG: hypothetical protein B7X04_03060 [Parcubacteria group bacterium 21-54-25]HQU07932.1 sigma-70 family RNA polymerase sigma factor [Candidatus Paceibacterota bacterium]
MIQGDNAMQQERFLKAYDQFADGVFRYGIVKLSNRDAALDLTQDTFMRYWNHLRRGGAVEHEQAFIFTIARRLVIDRYRAKRTTSLDQLRENNGFEPVDGHTTSPEEAADAHRAMALVNRLPQEYRDVLTLRYIEGLGPRDIASVTNLSANVVSVRLHRGIAKLRALMHTHHDND